VCSSDLLEGGSKFHPFEAADEAGFEIFVDEADFEIFEAMDEALQFSTPRVCVGEPSSPTAASPPATLPSWDLPRAVAVARPASRSTDRGTGQVAAGPTPKPGRRGSTAPRHPIVEHKVVLRPGQREYKCVAQTDQWFKGKFSAERFSLYINQLAAEGWLVIAVTTADRATWFGSLWGTIRLDIIVVLEREVTTETTVTIRPELIADKL